MNNKPQLQKSGLLIQAAQLVEQQSRLRTYRGEEGTTTGASAPCERLLQALFSSKDVFLASTFLAFLDFDTL
jgi:hypothetical protein